MINALRTYTQLHFHSFRHMIRHLPKGSLLHNFTCPVSIKRLIKRNIHSPGQPEVVTAFVFDCLFVKNTKPSPPCTSGSGMVLVTKRRKVLQLTRLNKSYSLSSASGFILHTAQQMQQLAANNERRLTGPDRNAMVCVLKIPFRLIFVFQRCVT